MATNEKKVELVKKYFNMVNKSDKTFKDRVIDGLNNSQIDQLFSLMKAQIEPLFREQAQRSGDTKSDLINLADEFI